MAAHDPSRVFGPRSPAEWGVRGGLALFALILAGISGAYSLACVLRQADPPRAHALAPKDARAAALLARQLSGPEASAADRRHADQIARDALRRDPTVVIAAATLGLNAQIRGDTHAARRLFTYSDRLSRRDLSTRLWLIEDAVSRQDVTGALHHYDIALRTARKAPELLYPVLASASNDPVIARQLVHTMAHSPPWNEGFIGFLAANSTDREATARLFRALHLAKVSVPGAASAQLIKALVSENRIDDAWKYYSMIHPNAMRDQSRDPNFTKNLEDPSLFDWQIPSEISGITAVIERRDHGGVFDFNAAASNGGVVLEQVQLLSTGNYVIEGHTSGIKQPVDLRPYWVVACSNGQEIMRLEVPNSAEHQGVFYGRFAVPKNCPFQTLKLVLPASSTISGISGQIDRIRLRTAS